MEVPIIGTGTANTASVSAWLARRGLRASVTTAIRDVERAPALVLPGVGSFGAAVSHLRTAGVFDALRERLAARRPTLCICLGMQLLFDASDESPGIAGLGIAPGVVRRLPPTVRVPHMGWNRVTPDAAIAGDTPLRPGTAYFANSYCVAERPAGWASATTTHGVEFVSAIADAGVLACQFHPELSGTFGVQLLDAWLTTISEGARC